MDDRMNYFWRVKLIRGNHFKIGVFEADKHSELKPGQAFSDLAFGWAVYSQGGFRHESASPTNTDLFPAFAAGDEIGVRLDRIKGVLAFSKNRGPEKVVCENPALSSKSLVASVAVLQEG
jgi:hypothetical protein